jgi:hypothetical protein
MKLSIKKIHLVMCAILIMNTIDGGFLVLEITSSKDVDLIFSLTENLNTENENDFVSLYIKKKCILTMIWNENVIKTYSFHTPDNKNKRVKACRNKT